MKTYTINKKQYHLSQDLIKAYPDVFKGYTNGRVFATKRKVDKKNYVYARLANSSWIKSDGSSCRFDKIFFLKGFIEENYVNNDSSSDSEFDDSDEVPDIIELDDNEKFVDNDDNIIEIEVRGEKSYDNIFFRVKDVMKGFELKSLNKNISDRKSGFVEKNDYFYFDIARNSGGHKSNELFLTYTGILRVLFASKRTTASKFVNWASKILFTAHLGTSDQKAELVGNLIGVSADTVKAVFNKTATVIPSIYLIALGTVKALRKKLRLDKKYKDNDFVYKFGMTIDLERRIKEHTKEYGKLGAKLKLVTFGLIDTQYISEAETDLKRNFNDWSYTISHDTYNELEDILEALVTIGPY